jgi:hypothetical protein
MPSTIRPRTQIDPASGKVPVSVRRLCDLAYLERSIHRMLCGWGNQFYAWEDKVAVCRHVWDQACIVERLRRRIDQFPGIEADAPVARTLETLANTVLQAPSFEDAVDGIYQALNTALVNAYLDFIQEVHPIHDAPTHQIIREIVTIKDLHRQWRSDYRRRVPHTTDPAYLRRIHDALADAGDLRAPCPVDPADPAAPAGVNTGFRPLTQRVNPAWLISGEQDILAVISPDFAERIETRRLFWPIGYMRELGLAMAQLRWLYDAPDLPWDFHYDESRHLWDESRHGDSGYARMRDFGIGIEEVGYTHAHDLLGKQAFPEPPVPTPAMTPRDLYDELFFIGLVAETGHFRVKREAYADFRDGGDLESAEMMLYDIIDETTHVQYAHKWLPLLARRAGIDYAGEEERAARIRQDKQQEEMARIEQQRRMPDREQDPAWRKYQQLLERLRRQCPLSNADTCPPRSAKPM